MNDFMKIAFSEAAAGFKINDGGPFGAVIVKNNSVLSRAHNEVLKTNDPTAHAEVLAIRRACEKLRTYSLENCRIYTSCEPCPMCLGAIMWARIPQVYFSMDRKDASSLGFDDEYLYLALSQGLKNEKFIMTQINKEYSLQLMKEWGQKQDKVIY